MRKTFRVVTVLGVGVVLAVGGAAGGKVVLGNAREAEACEGLQAYLQDPGLLVKSPDGAAGVAALGDSYTAGDGLEERGDGWAYQVAGTVAGVGSTGFVSGGYCGEHSYAERIAAVLETGPETLIIQGGLNDTSAEPEELRAAADALLEDAASVPRVVVVGPVNAPARDGEQAVDAALSEAAQTAGADYVSALEWELAFLPDDLHLTKDGHEEFAARVGNALD
ncbi:SGNH/GDSL hydrolase family protein [Kocuria salina]|uniref:SGNH/GDSL hydrolase family protein n=1 Tax=Kocuria salina TaxID=1929416 RepID=UPI0015946CA5|nr:SGNH/GDSL hydrolase family protein [Kocuria salina]NVC23414.1 SGNH/GDSL hydrolase family protein [Kocuria salina]